MHCQACGHENVNEARFCAACGAALPTRVENQQDPLVGQVIGNRYRITGVLGEGGMGVVYVGEQQMGSTIRKVAVKTLHPHLSKDASVLKRFHRECGTVAQLEHPNTIKVYDFGSTPDGTLYIAMEFVAGRALSDVLVKDGKLSPERVTQILRQICGALDEAHQLGIIHRDLKPDNIILTQRAGEQDFVKVLDFGIAARTESADAAREQKLTQQGTVLGTPPYMSPEQFTGKQLDRRSDVYSLGVMAYEMLTGALPFEAETPWQWATQHMTAQPKGFEVVAPDARIPEGMRQAIMRALSKESSQRQPSAGEFFAELSAGQRQSGETTANAVAQALPYQATAAMPEMPNFAAPGAAAPVASTMANPIMAPAATPSPMAAASPQAAVPVIAAPKPRSGNKTGLVLGLSGAGLAAVAVIVVMLVRSNKPTDDPGPLGSVITAPSSSAAAATVSAEIPQDTTTQASTGTPTVTPTLPANPQRKTTGKATATTTGTVTTTGTPTTVPSQTTPNPTPVPVPSTTPTQPTQPASSPACDACTAAASRGDIAEAARRYNGCTIPAAKESCGSSIRRGATEAAKTALRSHDCAKLQSIKAALDGAGISAPAVAAAANNCR